MLSRCWIAGLAVVVVAMVVAGCGGGNDESAGEVKYAHLYQSGPGGTPSIQMGWSGNISDPSLVVAWFVYRANNPGLAAEPYNLVDCLAQQSLYDYGDWGGAVSGLTFNHSFTYLDYGNQATGTIAVTYSRPGLVAGQTYYYRARRVAKPNTHAYSTAAQTAEVGTEQATQFSVTPSQALGEPSDPQGPVTYMYPATPTSPLSGGPSVDPRSVTFQWDLTTGADQYQVRIYSSASGSGQPVVQSPVVQGMGGAGKWTYSPGTSTPLQGGRTYYWVVGARRAGEATPTCGTESGWLKSSVAQFTTVTLPPPTP